MRATMQLESKLVPVLREAVTVLQAVLYKRLKWFK
jgi:hypothetical protein